jgi:hypothetical protein
MKKMLVLCLSTLLFMSAAIVPAGFAAEKSAPGVTRTQIEGVDNWAWRDTPLSPATITCPGGDCFTTGRMHFRGGTSWSCMTANDPRMTGVSVYTSNGNFDANATGPAWGTWMLVPTTECEKDGLYPEELVNSAIGRWYGTWRGQRHFDSEFSLWISKLKIVSKGVGGDLDGLHFKGMEWIYTITPLPVPYEFLPPELGLFDEPEAEFVGTIKE